MKHATHIAAVLARLGYGPDDRPDDCPACGAPQRYESGGYSSGPGGFVPMCCCEPVACAGGCGSHVDARISRADERGDRYCLRCSVADNAEPFVPAALRQARNRAALAGVAASRLGGPAAVRRVETEASLSTMAPLLAAIGGGR